MSSSRDFGVEQFFQADEFRADDPSPKNLNLFFNLKMSFNSLPTCIAVYLN